MIAQNPVAGARFFHYMCELFIKHVLGIGAQHHGFYGQTAGYYGVVEQQGRLTLHLHLLLWIRGVLTPQVIRKRILDSNSEFMKKMVEYLEGVHAGEFLTETMAEVEANINTMEKSDRDYKDPTQTLPEAPPHLCDTPGDHCNKCQRLDGWWSRFRQTVDDLVFRSNIHKCSRAGNRPSCINKHGNCKARFPRETFNQTEVDQNSGALNVKKGEEWINFFTPLVTYILRCNTDVTSLLSGTAIKAVVAYVSDYVTKPGLKTYTIFETIRSVFQRNSEMLGGSTARREKARRLITKIVNALTARMEIGGPMASLYLLGNPDHYTSHKFIPVYWKNYVREVSKAWKSLEDMDVEDEVPEKMVLQRSKERYIGISAVHDYIYRPEVYSDKTLYEWVQMAKRVKKPSSGQRADVTESEDEHDVMAQSKPQSLRVLRPRKPIVYTEPDTEIDEFNIQ